jgi:hypothetical protein
MIHFLALLSIETNTTLSPEYREKHGAFGVVPAVLVSVGLLVIVSLMTPASPDEKWAPFFDAGEGVETGGARS